MTPDELRRMDNSDCIIFEKGLKPVKAKKFWWFKKKNITDDLMNNKEDHNDYKSENRGEWRKFNPYNPYVEPKDEKNEDLSIGSLDDLFDEEPVKKEESAPKVPVQNQAPVMSSPVINKPNSVQGNTTNYQRNAQAFGNVPVTPNMANARDIRNQMEQSQGQMNYSRPTAAPVEEDLDIEKELEAKFDELFGSDD